MKTVVHVNQHIIKANQKTGARDPVLTVKQGRANRYAKEVDIDGPCRVIYSPDKALKCGARVWIETDAGVRLDPDCTGKGFATTELARRKGKQAELEL